MLENYIPILLKCPLFREVSAQELSSLLGCLNPSLKTYQIDEYIFTTGTVLDYIYIVLEGTVEIAKENLGGQKNIVAHLAAGQLFGEGVVCTNQRQSPVISVAHTPVTLMLIPYERIISSCSSSCHFHHRLIKNMMLLLGQKNYALNTKIDLLILKGMREKLATFLLSEAKAKGSLSFTLHLGRGELADYLNVARTSMCRELARMKADGLIDYYQNSFKLLDPEGLQKILT